MVEDALLARHGRPICGIALLPITVADAELRRLDRLGFRGVRFNFMKHLHQAASMEEVIGLGSRLADIGWHLQIHMESTLIEPMTPVLKRSPVPVVIDHIGRIDAGLGLEQAPFQSLRRLLQDDRFWVKVCGCDRITAYRTAIAGMRSPSRASLLLSFRIVSCGAPTGRILIMLDRSPMTACWSISSPKWRHLKRCTAS